MDIYLNITYASIDNKCNLTTFFHESQAIVEVV